MKNIVHWALIQQAIQALTAFRDDDNKDIHAVLTAIELLEAVQSEAKPYVEDWCRALSSRVDTWAEKIVELHALLGKEQGRIDDVDKDLNDLKGDFTDLEKDLEQRTTPDDVDTIVDEALKNFTPEPDGERVSAIVDARLKEVFANLT